MQFTAGFAGDLSVGFPDILNLAFGKLNNIKVMLVEVQEMRFLMFRSSPVKTK